MTTDAVDRLVVAHGFTQTHHHAHGLAFALARRCGFTRVVLPDLPGHGLASSDRASLDSTATGLTSRCGPGTYVGYSMGGRFLLAAAIARPADVHRLVLIGATAGIADPTARTERRRTDADRAEQLERVGLERFLADWLAMPMFGGVPASDRDVSHRERNTVSGLASSLRGAGTGAMTPLWDRLTRVTAPTLLVTGERDHKFTALGERLAALLPNAATAHIPNAGHAAHLERPTATLDVITDWITDTPV